MREAEASEHGNVRINRNYRSPACSREQTTVIKDNQGMEAPPRNAKGARAQRARDECFDSY